MIPPKLGRLGETSKFKVGDLVTKACWWAGRYPTSPESKAVMLVLESHGQAIKVLWSDGTIKADLSCNYVLVL